VKKEKKDGNFSDAVAENFIKEEELDKKIKNLESTKLQLEASLYKVMGAIEFSQALLLELKGISPDAE